MVRILNLEDEDRRITDRLGSFSVLEYMKDSSVSTSNAMNEYYMAEMGVRRRQLIISLNGNNSAILQAGAMQCMIGNVNATTGIKGVGDLFGKVVKSKVTNETAIKPEYVGVGTIILEPTYKYIVLQDRKSVV